MQFPRRAQICDVRLGVVDHTVSQSDMHIIISVLMIAIKTPTNFSHNTIKLYLLYNKHTIYHGDSQPMMVTASLLPSDVYIV